MVLLDTCALIEACKKTPDFSKSTEKKINAGAYLLSISFAELACKIKLAKLKMDISLQDLWNEVKQIENIKIVSIGVQEWLDAVELHWPENKDPADRLIVSYALQKKLPIVTSDQKIKAFYREVIWS